MNAIAKHLTDKQLDYLHVLKKQNAMADDEYRDLLEQAANVTTASELDSQGFNNVLQMLEDLGYEVVRWKPAPDFGDRPGMASRKQISYIDGLRQQIFGDENMAKFQSWLENHFNVSHLRFLDKQAASKTIEVLKSMHKKHRNYQ